jgi:hypothetical protein
LLSNEKRPAFPTNANATPLLLDGFSSHVSTVELMSISRKVLTLLFETVIGCPPVADIPGSGGGVL